MTRLTEKELAALESAKRAPIKLDEIKIDTRRGLLGNAHQLRAEFVAEQARGLGRSLRSLPVVHQVSEWAGARRRYRTTLRELSRLDQRGLDDLGISPG